MLYTVKLFWEIYANSITTFENTKKVWGQIALPSWKELDVWRDADTYELQLQKGTDPILHYVPLHSFKSAQFRLAPQLSCLSRPWQKCFFWAVHKWRHYFSSSFWPFPPPRYPFCIIYFPSIFDPLPTLKMKTSIIVGPFIVEPATFMHPSKFERKKNDRFFLAPWW